jgi:serine protease Do
MRSRHPLVRSFTAVVLIATAAYAQAPDPTLATLSRSFEQMVGRVGPSVVQIFARHLTDRSTGSGVIVDPSGHVVTNAHVVGHARRIQVLIPAASTQSQTPTSVIRPAGKLVPARLLGLDRETDLAVLKIEGDQPDQPVQPLPFGDSERLRQGQLVFAFGSPFGLENSVTMGIVSSPARQVQPDGPMIYIQTDAPINPGNSGGPLVDSSGALVGINTFIVSPSGSNAGIGFAAPSNIVRSVYEQIKSKGAVVRGHIGVKVQTITPQLATALELAQQSGVLIADVTRRGAAEAAGLEVKDIVLALNGKPLENARQFDVNIYGKAGETVTLDIQRGSRRLTKQVAVLEREPDREELLSRLEGVLVNKLSAFAVNLDEKATPLLPNLRRLAGVVIVANATEPGAVRDLLLLPGDVVYSVNGTNVSTVKELETAIASRQTGESVALQLERAGQLQFTVVELQ